MSCWKLWVGGWVGGWVGEFTWESVFAHLSQPKEHRYEDGYVSERPDEGAKGGALIFVEEAIEFFLVPV